MISRQDDENLFIMFSGNSHFWNEPQILVRPSENWELSEIGNCGSPIEKEDGWLLLTHGVGLMRKYCIGAVLLDLNDPTKVIGRLREPRLLQDPFFKCLGLLHDTYDLRTSFGSATD